VPSGLSPIKPLHRINHVFPLESEVLQSIQQVTIPLIHKFKIYIKHQSAFNPKYIRVAEVKYVKESTRRVLQKKGPRGPARTPALRTTRRGPGLAAITRPCSHGRAKGSTLLPTREAECLDTPGRYTTPQTGSEGYLQKTTSRHRLRFLNLSKTYPS
jgi:hypothetical protein